MKVNPNSHLTAKKREKMSYPARILFEKGLLTDNVLDFGCGFGKDVEELKNKGISIDGYDPHYFPEYPTHKFDTIICIYVLNVLMGQDQATILFEISQLLKIGGKAYFVVRRDVTYPGFRIHKIHQEKTYQCNVILPFRSLLKTDSFEIYEYQHYSFLNKSNSSVSPFFNDNHFKEQIGEIATAFAFYDKYPVSKGHSLIVPKRQVSNYFDLSFKEQSACWFLVRLVQEFLQKEYAPDGFNVGININEDAGQTVPHCHIHIIPRYSGDVEDPRGGVRGVIPQKQKY